MIASEFRPIETDCSEQWQGFPGERTGEEIFLASELRLIADAPERLSGYFSAMGLRMLRRPNLNRVNQ